MNAPNKLECFIIRDRYALPETNTLAYSAHFKIQRKKCFVNTAPGACTIKTSCSSCADSVIS